MSRCIATTSLKDLKIDQQNQQSLVNDSRSEEEPYVDDLDLGPPNMDPSSELAAALEAEALSLL